MDSDCTSTGMRRMFQKPAASRQTSRPTRECKLRSEPAGGPHPAQSAKGGSHLCAPNYCRRYRPAARHPEPVDTSPACQFQMRCATIEKRPRRRLPEVGRSRLATSASGTKRTFDLNYEVRPICLPFCISETGSRSPYAQQLDTNRSQKAACALKSAERVRFRTSLCA